MEPAHRRSERAIELAPNNAISTRGISLGRGRLVFGCVLLVISIVPWAVAPFTPLLGLPTDQLASIIAALLIGAEIIGAVAVAVLGREAYARITRRLRRSKNAARGASLPGAPQ